MKQRVIAFTILLSMLMPGCSSVPKGTTTVQETQNQEMFISDEDSKKITEKLSAAFDGFDCSIFAENTDAGVDFSLSMKCNISKAIFADFVLWFSTDVLELSDKNAIPISKVEVTFFNTTSNHLISWDSLDGKTGKLYNFTSDRSVMESVSPTELTELYGSAELTFPIE